jgi:hypothetical protein
MQNLLTLALEILAIAATLMMVADFFHGAKRLYCACATVGENKPETAPLSDPWEGEVEIDTITQPCCKVESAPLLHLLPPAQKVVGQAPIDYSDWTIRQLKKEAQRRQLKRYGNLTKPQLITALAAL